MPFSLKKILKPLGYVAASVAVLCIVAAAAVHLLSPYADRYRPNVEAWASAALHQPVKIQGIHTRWQAWHPAIRFDGITIYSQAPETPLLQIQRLQISFDMTESLLHWQLIPSQIRLSGTHLNVQKVDGSHYNINNIPIVLPDLNTDEKSTSAWQNLLLTDAVVLQHLDIDWHEPNAPSAAPKPIKLHIERLKLNLESGGVRVSGKKLTLQLPNIFSQPQFLNTYTGLIFWAKNSQGINIHANDWQLQNANLQVQGNLQLFLPTDDTGPQIDATLQISESDLSKLHNFIPDGILSPVLSDWFKQAFVAGDGLEGTVTLQGPLHHFPFDDNSGKFTMALKIKQLDFRYSPHWPMLTELSGSVMLHNRDLQIQVVNSKILGAETHTIQGEIPNLAEPELKVHGNLTTDAHHGVEFIHNSPLKQTIGKALAQFDLYGPMQLNLDMLIPLHAITRPATVNGNIALLPEVTLTVPNIGVVLKQLQGSLQFTADTLFSTGLQAQWLHQPVAMQISTAPNSAGENVVTFDLDGKADLAELQKVYDLDFIKSYASGAANYHAQLALSKDKQQQQKTRFTIDSDLQGVAINLPEPIKKTSSEKIPTHVAIEFLEQKNIINMLGNYAKVLSGAVTFQTNANQPMTFKGGELRFGATPAQLQTQGGLVIGGYLAKFDWGTLQPYWTSYNKDSGHKIPTNLALNAVDLTVGQLSAFGMNLQQANIQVQPKPTTWQIQINSPTIAGQCSIPKTGSRQLIEGEFQRFHIDPMPSTVISTIKPQDIPSLRITFHNFSYGQKTFGDVFLMSYPQADSMQIQKLNVTTVGSNLTATGQWRQFKTGRQLTQVNGKFTSTDLGATLKSWSITSSLVNGNGNLTFSAAWPGPAYNPDFGKLNGNFSLNFSSGRIINISNGTEAEMGLGRVLNLLSLQSLPRRLTLDFSDLVQKGFSFDTLQGDFILNTGNAITHNAYMKGPVAKVAINGRIGLGSKDYDLNMITTPYITSSLPAIATIAGGPIAGAATWVASKMLSSVVNKITSSTYHVSGSWDNPQIIKLSELKRNQERAMNLNNSPAS